MFSFKEYSQEIFATGIIIFALISLRMIIAKLIRGYANTSHLFEHRTNLVIKYINILMNILVVVSLIIIWGVKTEDIFVTVFINCYYNWCCYVCSMVNFKQYNIWNDIVFFFSFPNWRYNKKFMIKISLLKLK
jgi:hypothetical protein